MHEASLVQGLLQLIENSVQEHAAGQEINKFKVREIICEAGLLACFEVKTLSACLEIFAEGTICEGANLKIETEPLKCNCMNCHKQFTLTTRHFHCPECGSENIKFQGGNGLILKALNIDCEDCNNGGTYSHHTG